MQSGLSVCWSHGCAVQNRWTDWDATWGLTPVLLKTKGQNQSNPFTTMRGDKTMMRPFAKLLWTVVICSSLC